MRIIYRFLCLQKFSSRCLSASQSSINNVSVNIVQLNARCFHQCTKKFSLDSQLTDENNQNIINNNFAQDEVTVEERKEEISKAMKAYLERAKEYNEFMVKESREFEMGKRHLCNIMGWDPERITQDDIDRAIEYLMPSGLFDKLARPVMKPPQEIYPKRKAAEFDVHGRPFHSMFYTGKPNYYQLLHDIYSKFIELNNIEDDMIKSGAIKPHKEEKIILGGSEWLKYNEVKILLLERISEKNYEHLISTLDRLSDHPYSKRIEAFIMKFRNKLTTVSSEIEIPPLTYTEDGRPYVTAEGRRKNCFADVTVWGNGTGLITVNGHDLLYFKELKERKQIMFPLQFTDLLFKVDITANVRGEGVAAQAGAIRHALSLALRSFVDSTMLEDMRLAGLLTKDRRVRERKKPGQKGARAKFTWQKR